MVASLAWGLIVPSRRQIYKHVKPLLDSNLQWAYIEARFLQSERDQVEEVDKLTEDKALCARVL